MRVKTTKAEQHIFKNVSKFLRKKRILAVAVFLILYTVLVLAIGYVLKRQDFYGLVLKPVVHTNYRMIGNYFKSFAAQPQKISIDIKHIDFLKLAHKRQEALKVGRLYYSPGDWVPATLTHQGKRHKSEIRLKGYNDNH